MNTRERYVTLMTHQDADRTLFWEQSYSGDTLRRWYNEGLPEIKGIPDEVMGAVTARAESLGVPLENHPASDPHNHFNMDSFMLPGYRKLTSFLKDSGVNIITVDSDGYIWKLIPLWIEGGVTGLFPFEVAAGMDIVEVRKAFPKLGIIGGIDKRAVAQGKEAIDRELEAKIPYMLESGGYIPHLDHSVPPDISFDNFKYYRQKLKEIIHKHYGILDKN